ncbi:hypothetical protein ACFU51_09105 [Streptomyces sp. NPDC057430]|uniref:hypothetical protein n=1 Tax=Streptomyces sp. NPDC057430 TaxID=3346131 RepID=UPI003688D6F6
MVQGATPHEGRPWVGTALVEVHADGGETPDTPLTVRLTRRAPEALSERVPGLLSDHLLAVDGGPHTDNFPQFFRSSQSSAAVAAWMRRDEAANLVVDRLMINLPVTKAVGAMMDSRTCRVGLRDREGVKDGEGFLVTMAADVAGAPVELFPSLLLGWSYWWRRRSTVLRGSPRDLPLPPTRLDLVEKGRVYPVRLEDYQRTTWPSPPPRTPPDWLDMDEL